MAAIVALLVIVSAAFHYFGVSKLVMRAKWAVFLLDRGGVEDSGEEAHHTAQTRNDGDGAPPLTLQRLNPAEFSPVVESRTS